MAEVTLTIKGITRKQITIGVVCVVLVALIAGFFYFGQHNAGAGRLPRDSYKDLGFKVFFPNNPPAGFKFDSKSVSSTADVLAYKFTYNDKPVSVTVQPLDPQLDIASFRPTREIATDIGKGYLVEYDSRTTVAIIADKSFVIINSPQEIASSLVEQFAQSLAPVR